jgi:hypothetical protein
MRRGLYGTPSPFETPLAAAPQGEGLFARNPHAEEAAKQPSRSIEGFLKTDEITFRHSSDGGHFRRGGIAFVNDDPADRRRRRLQSNH